MTEGPQYPPLGRSNFEELPPEVQVKIRFIRDNWKLYGPLEDQEMRAVRTWEQENHILHEPDEDERRLIRKAIRAGHSYRWVAQKFAVDPRVAWKSINT